LLYFAFRATPTTCIDGSFTGNGLFTTRTQRKADHCGQPAGHSSFSLASHTASSEDVCRKLIALRPVTSYTADCAVGSCDHDRVLRVVSLPASRRSLCCRVERRVFLPRQGAVRKPRAATRLAARPL